MVTLFMYLGSPYKWTYVNWYFYTFLKINTLEHILYYLCLSYFNAEFQDRTDLCKYSVSIGYNILYFLILVTHSLSTVSVYASLASTLACIVRIFHIFSRCPPVKDVLGSCNYLGGIEVCIYFYILDLLFHAWKKTSVNNVDWKSGSGRCKIQKEHSNRVGKHRILSLQHVMLSAVWMLWMRCCEPDMSFELVNTQEVQIKKGIILFLIGSTYIG